MTLRDEIEKIIERIGSPWGEGARYGQYDGPSHLDDEGKVAMRKDLLTLIRSAVEEARIEELVRLLNFDSFNENYTTDKRPGAIVRHRIDELKKLNKILGE